MKCKNCINYIENENFDYYDSTKGSFAECNKERDDIFESEFDGVFQEVWGYDVDCSDYKEKVLWVGY